MLTLLRLWRWWLNGLAINPSDTAGDPGEQPAENFEPPRDEAGQLLPPCAVCSGYHAFHCPYVASIDYFSEQQGGGPRHVEYHPQFYPDFADAIMFYEEPPDEPDPVTEPQGESAPEPVEPVDAPEAPRGADGNGVLTGDVIDARTE